jgi:hypothetical protein
MKRFLDMLQDRFVIGFRYFVPFTVLRDRMPTTLLVISHNPSSEFSFNSIPISIAHHHPRETSGCMDKDYGSSAPHMKKIKLILNGIQSAVAC